MRLILVGRHNALGVIPLHGEALTIVGVLLGIVILTPHGLAVVASIIVATIRRNRCLLECPGNGIEERDSEDLLSHEDLLGSCGSKAYKVNCIFMFQRPFAKHERYIRCPGCGKSEHQVSHLPVGKKTAWYCEECGIHFRLHVISADAVDCEPIPGERQEKRLVVLRSTAPVTLHVEATVYVPAEGNRDPHGVFEFISMEPWVKPKD